MERQRNDKGLTISLLLIAYCLLLTDFAFAAPHITGKKPEPFPAKVGRHLSERMKAKALAPSLMVANATTGAIKVLFLKVDFQADTDATTTGNGTWADPIYAYNNDSDYWVNKDKNDFINYYNEVSYGQLVLQVDIFPQTAGTAYRLPNPMASYGNESDTALRNLIYDSVTKAEAVDGASINFSNYDAILIVHAGAGEETDINGDSSNDIWSLYYPSSTAIVTADGKAIFDAIIMPQTGAQDGRIVDPLGIYAHEFGHWLGLPDLYPTGNYFWDGIGKWGLMGNGIYLKGSDGIAGSSPSHPDAWCKKYLGWVTPQEFLPPTDPGSKTLAPIEAVGNKNQVFKLQASTTTPSQYFLLENRQQTGFDSGLPGSGMLVWLIDEAIINANIAGNTVNNNPVRPGVRPMEADGDNALGTYGGDYGSAGDPFPGSTNNANFTPRSSPSSTPYIGNAWVNVRNIQQIGNDISFITGFSPDTPQNLSAVINCSSETIITWSGAAATDLSGYKIYKNGVFFTQTTTTSFTDISSAAGTSYNVSSMDTNGNESPLSIAVYSVSASNCLSSGNSNSNNNPCFIATAAFGSYEAPYVKILREFRDRFLLTNTAGSVFVHLYYKASPPIAHLIEKSEFLKAIIRVLLLPFIGIALFFVKTTAGIKLFSLLLLFVLAYSFRRHRKGYLIT